MNKFLIDIKFYIHDEATRSRCIIDFRNIKDVYDEIITNFSGSSGSHYYCIEFIKPISPIPESKVYKIYLNEDDWQSFKKQLEVIFNTITKV